MRQILTHIRQQLSAVYPDSEANAIARMVLECRFGISLLDICMGKDIQLLPKQRQDLDNIVARLSKGEPVQYVLGKAEFCGFDFSVAPGVLIPRPETEDLVDWIVADSEAKHGCSILDIGTGSGCIAISLKKLMPDAIVTAWDLSDDALRQATANARQLDADVLFEQVDVLNVTPSAKFDIIVSNPPYICNREKAEMSDNVLSHEPHLALFVPDDDPLMFYRAIAVLGCEMLNEGGAIFFEINRAFGSETTEMLASLGYKDIELRKDRFDNDRMIKAVL